MGRVLRVSEPVYELIDARRRDGETVEDTLRRLAGPDPESLRAIVAGGDETAAAGVRRAIDRRRAAVRERRTEDVQDR